jgi:DNA-binding winged helix-turn-helix (wHTH) protein
MTEPGTRIVYEFDEFRLDLQQRLLSRADGRPIPLTPKIFDTLLYFVERRGELLDKATLMKAIWPNIVVEENSPRIDRPPWRVSACRAGARSPRPRSREM